MNRIIIHFIRQFDMNILEPNLIYLLNYIINQYNIINISVYSLGIGDWGLGIGDWGLGIGDLAQSPIPNPQSPIPNPPI